MYLFGDGFFAFRISFLSRLFFILLLDLLEVIIDIFGVVELLCSEVAFEKSCL
jgi:hypothetical protein